MTETKIDRKFFDICEAYQKMVNNRSMICENLDFEEYDERNPSEENNDYRYMSDDTIHEQYSGWWLSWIEKENGDRGISVSVEIHFPSADNVDFDNSSVLWYLYPRTQVGRHRQYESPIKNPVEMNGVWLPEDIKDEVLDVIDYIYETFSEGQTMEFDDKEEFDEWKVAVPGIGESYCGNEGYANICESFDQPEYKRYVVINDKIESGWDYPEDAKDRKNELEEDGIPSKILSRQFLKRNGIDPSDDGNWITGDISNYV